jgi:hypothetical protein
MATGAPRPGGYRAPAPGGTRTVPSGGTNLNSFNNRLSYAGYPDFDISPSGDSSGARVAQTRTVVNLRRGRAPGNPTYNWTLPTRPGGSTATVTNGTTASASFTPDVAGLYVFRVAVTFSDSTVITKEVRYTSA